MARILRSGFCAPSRDRERLAGALAPLILAALAVALPAFAQDSPEVRREKLKCALLGGDLTEPFEIIRFRQCLANAQKAAAGQQTAADRPNTVAPAGFGANSRAKIAEGIERFQIANGKIAYAFVLGADGRLWRAPIGSKESTLVDQSVALFHASDEGALFALGTNGDLQRESETGRDKSLIDHTVADFQPLDDKTIYVLGADRKLWRENGTAQDRALVDQQVASFQAITADIVYVLGSDGKLWREKGDMRQRSLVAQSVGAFHYLAEGDTVYVLTANALWRQQGTQTPEEVDHDVAAFQAVDMHLAYVLGADGRLWRELGNREHAELVDGNLSPALGAAGFQALDAQTIYLMDRDHKLWAEKMPPGR